MSFLEENNFCREKYDTCLKRIHYDDRDTVMYENMLRFLFSYIVDPGSIEDREGIMKEYTFWNEQLIDKCLYHLPHDLPYRNICRAYQSVVCLLAGKLEEGISQLQKMGNDAFSYDGKAPKIIMIQDGKRYEPMSKLFLLYNYAKAFRYLGMEQEEKELCSTFPHAFTLYGDEEHEEHDQFFHQQMEEYKDVIFYPVYQRVYKMRGGPADFYVYYDKDKFIPVDCILTKNDKENREEKRDE